MQKNVKKKTSVKAEPKPFLRGTPIDSRTLRFALKFFGIMALTMIGFLILSTFLTIETAWLRIIINLLVLAAAYLLYYNSGMNSGTDDVNLGEMLYIRKEHEGAVTENEQKRCYHPLKGLVKTLLGLLPYFLIAILLAVMTKKQYTGLGALPSWVLGSDTTGMTDHALNYYSVTTPMGIEDISRIIVRLLLMPWVGIFDSSNADAMVLLERISPVLTLLPAIAYWAGYLRGPEVRAQVQKDIAKNNRKRAKKARKQQKARASRRNGPEQLN